MVSWAVDKVVLHSGGRSRSVGQVPAGEYTASVTFPAREPIEVGPFEVVAEGIVTLARDAACVNCAIRK